MWSVARVFPALSIVKKPHEEKENLVRGAIVEELLLPLGQLDFGKAIVAKSDVSLWRTRGEHMPLVGEFAFQVKFVRKQDVHRQARELAEQLFVSLQRDVKDCISLVPTKTVMVTSM